MIETRIIEFKGMPLFQKARFHAYELMQGSFSDFACFFYMVEGQLKSFDGRGLHSISEKEAIVKNCGSYVQQYIPKDLNQECEAIAIYLYPDLLREVYKNEVPSFLEHSAVPKAKKYVGNKLIEQFMMNLSIYFEAPELIDEELGVLKIKELMMILLKSESQDDIRKMLSEIFAPVNIAFRQAVENNLFNPLSLEQLAFVCNMSLSTFKREFKRTFETTPAKYIKTRRLERAAVLLETTDRAVSAVAFDSGFQDVSTFSSVFGDQYGMSPTKFRLNQVRN